MDLVGAEVLIWTGNGGLDEASMETAVWPAVAAMAENAWTRKQENEGKETKRPGIIGQI